MKTLRINTMMKVWVARDKNGALWVFENAPLYNEKFEEFYCEVGELASKLDERFFPEVTFENSPRKVELKLC